MDIIHKLTNPLVDLSVLTWDLGLFLMNLVFPAHSPNHVIPPGLPGHAGKWPEYVPPGEGDSRSACPMLNAMFALPFPHLTNPIYGGLTPNAQGKPQHPPTHRQKHLLPSTHHRRTPDLQPRPLILFLRAPLLHALPKPLLLDGHLRPLGTQQAQRD